MKTYTGTVISCWDAMELTSQVTALSEQGFRIIAVFQDANNNMYHIIAQQENPET